MSPHRIPNRAIPLAATVKYVLYVELNLVRRQATLYICGIYFFGLFVGRKRSRYFSQKMTFTVPFLLNFKDFGSGNILVAQKCDILPPTGCTSPINAVNQQVMIPPLIYLPFR
jgi:hypothetical protein